MCDIEAFVQKIHSKKQFTSFEITPSVGANIDSHLLTNLKECDFLDGFVCTDSPLARFKPSSVLSSLKFQNALQKPVICTLSMRDRNSIALCGDILGVNELGIRLFLSLTGDPIKLGDSKDSKGVFEGNSTKLSAIIQNLNNGFDLNGKELKSKVYHIYNFNVINAYTINQASLQTKINKKITNGCEALFTQPVFSKDSADFLLECVQKANQAHNTNVAIIFGFFPVLSYKVALFLRDKLPGVFIPESWICKLEKASSKGKQEEYKVGMELSKALYDELGSVHNKFHFMTSNNLESLQTILS